MFQMTFKISRILAKMYINNDLYIFAYFVIKYFRRRKIFYHKFDKTEVVVQKLLEETQVLMMLC